VRVLHRVGHPAEQVPIDGVIAAAHVLAYMREEALALPRLAGAVIGHVITTGPSAPQIQHVRRRVGHAGQELRAVPARGGRGTQPLFGKRRSSPLAGPRIDHVHEAVHVRAAECLWRLDYHLLVRGPVNDDGLVAEVPDGHMIVQLLGYLAPRPCLSLPRRDPDQSRHLRLARGLVVGRHCQGKAGKVAIGEHCAQLVWRQMRYLPHQPIRVAWAIDEARLYQRMQLHQPRRRGWWGDIDCRFGVRRAIIVGHCRRSPGWLSVVDLDPCCSSGAGRMLFGVWSFHPSVHA
jgi:hypothetical protein